MDKQTSYRNLIKRILSEYVELSNRQPQPGIETILIMDEARGHYMWLKLGWADGKRAKYITVYVRLRDARFWIEEDWTEGGIASELVREGIPREDIVLAFHDPETRKHTDFAAARTRHKRTVAAFRTVSSRRRPAASQRQSSPVQLPGGQVE